MGLRDTPNFILSKADVETLQRAIIARQRETTDREELYRLAVLYTYLVDCFEVRIITE